jgi:hypothetical protein
MKSGWFLTSAMLLIAPGALHAQTSNSPSAVHNDDVPAFIVAGMNAYKEKGPDEAFKVWIQNSPIDGSKDAMAQADVLRQVQDYYGAFRGFDVIGKRELGPRSRILYLVINYEKGPLFVRFLVYKPDKEWILTLLNFNTNPQSVLPDSF